MNHKIQRTILDNGIKVISAFNPTADIVAGRLFLQAGSRREPREKAGLAHLLATVITKGTQQLSSVEIADRVESVGASFSTDAATDYFIVSLKTVSADFVPILHLAGEILRSPIFPTPEVELEKNLTIQSILSQQEQPFNVAFSQLREAMYPDHPYGVSVLGTKDTVERLTRLDLQQYHHSYFRPDNLIISLCGSLTHIEAVELVNKVFGDWEIPVAPLPTPQLPNLAPQPQSLLTPQTTQQSILMLGYMAPSVHNQDYLALKLINTYLGNGLSSRLFVELREKRGLAYDVSAFYPTRLDASQFVVYIGTAPANTSVALAGLQAEVKHLWEHPLSNEDLQIAKNKLLGQYALGKQTNAEIAQIFGWYETLGLGVEFDTRFPQVVSKITPVMIQEVAHRYFTISPYVSLVGPAEAINNFKD